MGGLRRVWFCDPRLVISDHALGKVGMLEESAHRYGGLHGGPSRPRRNLARGQDFSKVLHSWPRLRTTLRLLIERPSNILLQAKWLFSPGYYLGCLRVLGDDDLG